MGNSLQVAQKHYLQVTDEHFERATDEHFERATKSGAESGAQVAQNAAQHAHAAHRTDSQKRCDDRPNPLHHNDVTPTDAAGCDVVLNKMAEVHGNRTHRPHG